MASERRTLGELKELCSTSECCDDCPFGTDILLCKLRESAHIGDFPEFWDLSDEIIGGAK